MSLSTLEQDSFSEYYAHYMQSYIDLGMVEINDIRCRLHDAYLKAMKGYRYDVKFWAEYLAAEDAYYQAYAKVASFRGVSDPCTFPGRGENVRVYAQSGRLLYASVDTGEVAIPFAQRRRVPKDRGDTPAHPDR